jgi:predicted ATPase/DNA-binding SARP family transcriptional activator/Tfp pilus assembly protein PilF
MAYLSISLLGALHVTRDGELVTGFATDKARALLAYLAVESDRPHRRDTLAGLLWPDQPQSKARQSLRQALSELRKTIGDSDDAPFLLVSREALQFDRDSEHWLDVAELANLVKECETHRHRRLATCLPCIRRLERVVALYRGPFLEQFFLSDSDAFEEWAVLKREWLQREVVEALFLLTDYHERRGDHKQAQQYARRQVALEPWREEVHRQLMRLLALDGQRSAALAQYEVCRRTLERELGVETTAETQALYERIRAEGATSSLPRTSTLLHSLPSTGTAFVGREAELAEIAELLANPDCRLVTLFGPGGIGKTRLALQVAAEHLGAFRDGVAFVPLASVDRVEHLIPAIATALGAAFRGEQEPEDQLLSYLSQRELMLVLDNLEHILESAGFLSRVLQRAPDVVLVVTSRERLNLHEEWVYEVGGLVYPEGESAEGDTAYSALDLFRERARQVDRGSALLDADILHVVRICQLVEGMPLGIELAASWVAVHSCEEIAEELSSSLGVLATRLRTVTERHRSMWATMDHSWQLLTEEEKGAFVRLSVFRGGFSREAAGTVAKASPSLLAALQDKSLVRRVSSHRYELHEMLRQYGAERLQSDPGVCEETQVAHVRYFSAFLAQREEMLQGEGLRQALGEIALEIENARQAWQTAVVRGCADWVAQSLESLYRFYNMRCRFDEGLALLGLAVDRWRDVPEHERVLGQALARQGAICQRLGRYDQAISALRQSLEIFERLGACSEEAFCLTELMEIHRRQGRYEQAGELAQRSLALSRQSGDSYGVARALFGQGMVWYRIGQVDRAEALLEESLAVSRACGNRHLAMSILSALGDIAGHQGDYDESRRLFESCLELSREFDDQYSMAMYLNNLGTVLHVIEEYPKAQQYYRESLEMCRQIGDRNGQAIALSNMGEIAHILGRYDKALGHYQEALAIGRDIQDRWTILACLNNLGETACAVEDYDGASAYLTEALVLAYETQTLPVLFRIMVNLAVLFFMQGRKDRAAMLLKLAHEHLASDQETKQKAMHLSDDLGLSLPGHSASLASVVADILDELS